MDHTPDAPAHAHESKKRLIDGRYLLHLAISAVLGAVVMLGALTMLNRTRPAPIVIVPPEPTPTALPTGTPSPVQVYVNGEVNDPDIYLLDQTDRIEMAIEAAGGFTDDAYEESVNLAQPVYDGLQVYVPKRPAEGETPPVAPGNGSQVAPVSPDAPSGEPININTATAEELDTLPGIGPGTAGAIIEYREENGPFLQIEALMNVSGIGQAKFNKIADLITVR